MLILINSYILTTNLLARAFMIVVAVLALLRSTDAIAVGKANVADVLAAVNSKIISKINGLNCITLKNVLHHHNH